MAEGPANVAAGRRRVAFFGGSFNPPHVAHVLAVTYVLSVAPIDEVIVVPVYQHPFAKELAPYEDRLEMCRLALGWLPRVQISTLEGELGGESRTLRTLEHLVTAHPDWSMRLLVGADVVADLPKWHRFERIAKIAPPIVLGRVGVALSESPGGAGAASGAGSPGLGEGQLLISPEPVLPGCSSTEVRQALAAGDIEGVRWQLPRAVLDYIVERGLYRRD
jgi:nicotinate-nucleotide adenylyltransferase